MFRHHCTSDVKSVHLVFTLNSWGIQTSSFFLYPAFCKRLFSVCCCLCRSGIENIEIFLFILAPFRTWINFWYNIPISITFCEEYSFRDHLSNAHTLLLTQGVITESYSLVTQAVGKHHELLRLTIITQSLNLTDGFRDFIWTLYNF